MFFDDFKWVKEEENNFYDALRKAGNANRIAWTKQILNTELEVFSISSDVMRKMASEIYKKDYQAFLALRWFQSYESTALYGLVISKIKDSDLYFHHLEIYKYAIENWALCDLLSFHFADETIPLFLTKASNYLNDPKPFIRRLGLFILFKLIRDETYLEETLEYLIVLKNETEYYVIMMAGWLLSEALIKYPEKTKHFITATNLNPKIVNKGIQKCRESRRLTPEEKEALLTYKRK